MTSMVLAPLLQDATLVTTFALPGTVVDSKLFSRVGPDSAALTLSLRGMLELVGEIVRSDTLARLLVGRRAQGNGTALSDLFPVLDSLATRHLFGGTGEFRIEIRPSGPRFDYAAQCAAATRTREPGLDSLLAEARRPGATERPGSTVRDPDFNYECMLPAGWVRYEPGYEMLPGSVALRHRKAFGLIAPQHISAPRDPVAFANLVLAHEASRRKVVASAIHPTRLGSIDFVRVALVQRPKAPEEAGESYMEYWLTSLGATTWRIAIWGAREDSLDVQRQAAKLVAGFSVLDSSRAGPPVADVERPEFGYAVRGIDAGWSPAQSSTNRSTLIDLFWITSAEGFVIAPVRFDVAAPDLPAITRGMLNLLEFDESAGTRFPRSSWKPERGEGEEISASRTVDGQEHRYTLRVVRLARSALLIGGWWLASGGDPERVRRVLDAVMLTEPAGRIPESSDVHRAELGLLCNQVALSYSNRGLNAEAEDWSRRVYELRPSDPLSLYNLAYTMKLNHHEAEALRFLERNIDSATPRDDSWLLLAQLQIAAGDTLRANRSFLRAIELGFDDEDEVVRWSRELVAGNRIALAESTLVKWEDGHPTLNAHRWRAEIMRARGDAAGATALLRRLHAEHPDDVPVGTSLMEALVGAGDVGEACAMGERLLARQPDNVAALNAMGWALLARQWYREAGSSFEKALQFDAENEEARRGLRQVSSQLGQGDRVDITRPLAPVPMPREIVDAAARAPADFGRGESEVTLLEAVGYALAPGSPVRHTTYYRVKVQTTAAAARRGTLEFEFHPAHERIYVNRIEVRDSSGGPPVLSDAGDTYVIDRTQTTPDGGKLLHVQVQGVKPGCTIEAQVTREKLDAQAPADFDRWLLSDGVPSATIAVWIAGDTSRVRTSLSRGEGVQRVRRTGLSAWIAQPAYHEHVEPWSTLIEDRAPLLTVAAPESSWATCAREYLADLRPLLSSSPDVMAKARQLAEHASTDSDRIARIGRWLQSQVQYRAVAFGPRARRPLPASQVMSQHFGDCKDQSLLMHLMLAAVGIRSSLALVNTQWRIEPRLPTLDQFDHMVLLVPALGEGWLIDPTLKTLAPELHPASGFDQSHVLVLDESNPRLLPPSGPLPTPIEARTRSDVSVAGEDLAVHEVITLESYIAAWYRSWLQDLSASDRVTALQTLFASQGDVQVQRLELGDLENLAAPLTVTLEYTVRNAVSSGGGRFAAAPPCPFARQLLEVRFVADRHNDFTIRYPMRLVSDVTFHLPSAPLPQASTPTLSREGAFCRWTLERRRGEKPGDALLHLEVECDPGVFPAGRYAEFRDALLAPVASLGRTLEW